MSPDKQGQIARKTKKEAVGLRSDTRKHFDDEFWEIRKELISIKEALYPGRHPGLNSSPSRINRPRGKTPDWPRPSARERTIPGAGRVATI